MTVPEIWRGQNRGGKKRKRKKNERTHWKFSARRSRKVNFQCYHPVEEFIYFYLYVYIYPSVYIPTVINLHPCVQDEVEDHYISWFIVLFYLVTVHLQELCAAISTRPRLLQNNNKTGKVVNLSLSTDL